MELVVFGAGSLGSLIGGILAREHAVTLVGRDPHVSAVDAEGLTITGEIEASVAPAAGTAPPERADLAVVTVKSFDTPAAVDALADCSLDGVLSLQNGMGNEERLVEGLDCPVLAGTCTYGARLAAPGEVECTGIGEITLGPLEGGNSPLASHTGKAFDRAGLVTTVSSAMPRQRWAKLAVNAGINAPTALARIQNGVLGNSPAGSVATAAARETARVARECGIDLDGEHAVERMQSVASATAVNTSSMHQDVLAERRTEIDAINGYVVDRTENSVPVNETLTALVRGWERGQGLRPS